LILHDLAVENELKYIGKRLMNLGYQAEILRSLRSLRMTNKET